MPLRASIRDDGGLHPPCRVCPALPWTGDSKNMTNAVALRHPSALAPIGLLAAEA